MIILAPSRIKIVKKEWITINYLNNNFNFI
jgi:hypothetical protein